MIYSYGVTKQGTYHIKNNTVCQDAHFIKKIGDRFAIAAAADGLGSEKFTDAASKAAAKVSVEYCAERITPETAEKEILKIIKDAFSHSWEQIRQIAAEKNEPITEFDTTLTLAVYRSGTVYFGQSGDSGIVVLCKDGTFKPLTKQQRDENGLVFPLCFGEEKWEFGREENVASVLLATDGIYETLFPYLLRNEPVTIYAALALALMTERSLGFEKNGEAAVTAAMEAYIESIPNGQVSDDKTIVVMLDTDVEADWQPDDYYSVPDWEKLKRKFDEEYRKAAYPHLDK